MYRYKSTKSKKFKIGKLRCGYREAGNRGHDRFSAGAGTGRRTAGNCL